MVQRGPFLPSLCPRLSRVAGPSPLWFFRHIEYVIRTMSSRHPPTTVWIIVCVWMVVVVVSRIPGPWICSQVSSPTLCWRPLASHGYLQVHLLLENGNAAIGCHVAILACFLEVGTK